MLVFNCFIIFFFFCEILLPTIIRRESRNSVSVSPLRNFSTGILWFKVKIICIHHRLVDDSAFQIHISDFVMKKRERGTLNPDLDACGGVFSNNFAQASFMYVVGYTFNDVDLACHFQIEYVVFLFEVWLEILAVNQLRHVATLPCNWCLGRRIWDPGISYLQRIKLVKGKKTCFIENLRIFHLLLLKNVNKKKEIMDISWALFTSKTNPSPGAGDGNGLRSL